MITVILQWMSGEALLSYIMMHTLTVILPQVPDPDKFYGLTWGLVAWVATTITWSVTYALVQDTHNNRKR